MAGSVAGGLLLGAVPSAVLEPLVVALLAISTVKIRRHASCCRGARLRRRR